MPHQTYFSIAGCERGPFHFNDAMRRMFEEAVRLGIFAGDYRDCLPKGHKWKIWVVPRLKTYSTVTEACQTTPQDGHERAFDADRYYTAEQEVVHQGTTGYVVSTQWGFVDGRPIKDEFIPSLQARFPFLGIEVTVS